MKRFISLFLIVAFLGSMMVMTGCFGGGSGGIGAIFAGVLVIAIVASSGGAGAAAFAANVHHKPNAAIVAASRATVKYKARIKINGNLATETTNLTITDELNPQTITGNITVSPGTSNPQVSVEILPASSTTDQPFLKQYFVATVADGQTTNATSNVTTAETAKALAYDQWSGASANPITAFAPAAASLTALQTAIENQLITDLPAASPDFAYPGAVTNQAKAIASATPVLTTFTVTGANVMQADGLAGSTGTTMTLVDNANTSSRFTATTNAGNYSFSGVPNGTYTLTPTKTGHTFSPTSATVVVNGANVTVSQGFQASTSGTTTPTYNVTGTWDMTTGSGSRFTATFVQTGSTVTGNGPNWTFSGIVVGAQMTLTTTAASGYSERWDLTAASNSSMSGTWTTIAGTGVGNSGSLSGTKVP